MSQELVTVMTFMSEEDAELKRMLLERAGIQGFITDAEVVSMTWLLGNAVGAIKLQVAEADAERAVDILKNAAHTHRKENHCLACNAKMTPDQSVCPQCGWTYEKTE